MVRPAETMEAGKKYWIRYRIPGLHRADRVMVAKFLAIRGVEVVLSGRPEFGTTELNIGHVLMVREVAEHAECYVDRKA